MKILITLFSLFLTNLAVAQTSIEFSVDGIPDKGYANVGIRGNQPPLSWDKSIVMTKDNDGYKVTIEFPKGTNSIEYKFVIYNSDEKVLWEGTENRKGNLKNGETFKSVNTWDVEQYIDPNTLPKLTVEELMADYELIETMVLKVHPATYRYNDDNSIRRALDELKEKFSQPINYGEMYLAISALLAQIKCDHTFASYYNQNAKIKSVIHRQQDKLPFTFKWIENKMIVVYDATAKNILSGGTEILAINDVPVSTILEKMLPYIPADGNNDASRVAQTQIEGYDFRYDTFDVFHPLLFPITSTDIRLKIKKYGVSETSDIMVKSATRASRAKKLKERYPNFPKVRDDLWRFNITEDHIGLLTLGSFGLTGWKSLTLDYKDFLADAFAELRQKDVKSLIIDIRDNRGGNDEMAQELFTYFNIAAFTDKRYEGRSRYKSLPESLKPYLKNWGPNPWYYELNPDRLDDKTGYYIFEKEFIKKRKNKIKNTAFKDEIYLLTSGGNVSLAYYLAEDVKRYKTATIIGQETGGNLKGISGGTILFLTLPNSSIEIDFPIIGSFSIEEQPDSGVRPDINVFPNLDDVYNGVDAELKVAIDLIKKRQ